MKSANCAASGPVNAVLCDDGLCRVTHGRGECSAEGEDVGADEEAAGEDLLLPGNTPAKRFAPGIAAAVLAGLLGGLILIPMKFSSVRGLDYVPSMAAGVAVAMPLPLMLHLVIPMGLAGKEQHCAAAIPGIASGIVWNVGNICSMIAVETVGLAVAYPIMQAGLFVAALWGILLFNELPGKPARLRFLLDGSIVLVGVVLLSMSVKG
jgi:glucose uptake protein GlcU